MAAKPIRILMLTLFVLAVTAVAEQGHQEGQPKFDHSAWDRMLDQYVEEQFRVDYRQWKEDGTGELDSYLAQFSEKWPDQLSSDARMATLINAYNAFTIRWILSHYPVESIWKTPDPFDRARHMLDGKKVSLDEIETRLRNTDDPRIHSALVCAARSCPPLRREAYTKARVDEQLEDNTRTWLSNSRLNEFHPDRNLAEVSKVFKWYRSDFEEGTRSLRTFLMKYGPPSETGFLERKGSKIKFKPYDWGLNDVSSVGSDYGKVEFLWDRMLKVF